MAVPSSGNQRTPEQGSSDSDSRRSKLSITWESTGGAETKGVVTFHGLDDRLSRVEVEMEYDLSGSDLVGNLLRIPRWRFRRDLKLPKQDEETEVVEKPGAQERGGPKAEEPQEPEAEEHEEPAAEEPREPEAEEHEEPEAKKPGEPAAEEPGEPEAESGAQWQVRRRAPGRPSRPRR